MRYIVIAYIIATIIVVAGWIQGIVKLAHCDFKPPYKAEVIYGVGTFLPVVGAVVGWMDIGK